MDMNELMVCIDSGKMMGGKLGAVMRDSWSVGVQVGMLSPTVCTHWAQSWALSVF